jgi:hypothetical protein
LGGAGVFGSEERIFAEHEQLLSCLRSLGVSDSTMAQYEGAVQQLASSTRFVGFAEREQIVLERLQNAGFDIFTD